MNREKQKDIIKEALGEYFESEQGETMLGTIVCKALYQHINSYEFEMEKTTPDGVKEAKTIKGDILKYIAQWIKNSEGAIRGVQSDAAQARNRAVEARDVALHTMQAMQSISQGLPAIDIKKIGE